MRIYAINGSAKGEASNSREMISIVQGYLGQDAEIEVVSQIRQYRKPDDSVFPAMAKSDVLLVSSSLYVDSLPATLMAFLERYSAYLAGAGKDARAGRQRVFACVNCGFFEGVQNASALEVLAHFSAASGLVWSGGVGVGTGEMIAALKGSPLDMPIRKPVTRALRAIADAIAAGPEGRLERNLFVQHAFPSILYKLAGEAGWRKQVKAHGLKTRDLFRKPLGLEAETD
jgi:multimeric flavodoxin WrbA